MQFDSEMKFFFLMRNKEISNRLDEQVGGIIIQQSNEPLILLFKGFYLSIFF